MDWSKRDSHPIPVLASVARLGKKYQIDFLFDRAVECLKSIYPDTLEKWDENTLTKRFSPYAGTWNAPLIAKLGHQQDIPILLPAAFFLMIEEHNLEGLFKPGLPPPLLSRLVIGRDKLRDMVASDTYCCIMEDRIPHCSHPDCQLIRENNAKHFFYATMYASTRLRVGQRLGQLRLCIVCGT